jgi:hypothetical protein
MGLGLAGVQAFANRDAIGAEFQTPLEEIIDQIIIERDHGVRTLVFGFQQNPFGASGLKVSAIGILRSLTRCTVTMIL